MPKHDLIATTDTDEIEALMARLEAGQLRDGDTHTLHRLLRTLLSLVNLLQHKNASIARLKRLLFGPRSDTRSTTTTKPVLDSADEPLANGDDTRLAQSPSSDTAASHSSDSSVKPKRPGHGRLPASAYTGARVEQCVDPKLKVGSACPDAACTGHLYDTKAPAILIRL